MQHHTLENINIQYNNLRYINHETQLTGEQNMQHNILENIKHVTPHTVKYKHAATHSEVHKPSNTTCCKT